MYRRADVERVLHIKQLVFADGLTLAGVRRRIDEEAPPVLEEADAAPIKELLGRNAKERLAEVKRGLMGILDMLERTPRRCPRVCPSGYDTRGRSAKAQERFTPGQIRPRSQRKNDAVSGDGQARSEALVCLVYGLSGRPFMRGACARWPAQRLCQTIDW